jgi:hypothetical protein
METNVGFGFSVTPGPRETPPPATNTALVAQELVDIPKGINDADIAPPTYTVTNLVGGTAIDIAVAAPNFPNRPQGHNECAPAGILNSLEYLDGLHHLGIDPSELTMEKMKQATAWTTNGSYEGWVQKKDEYMKAHGLPIETLVTTNAVLASIQLFSGSDVELRIEGHLACVVGTASLGEGRYALLVAHDLAQGVCGGETVEAMLLDTRKKEVLGPLSSYGRWQRAFIEFIIEKPRK